MLQVANYSAKQGPLKSNFCSLLAEQLFDFTESELVLYSYIIDDAQSKGYQIHIKSQINDADRVCIESIVNLHQLAMKVVDDYLIIYKKICY